MSKTNNILEKPMKWSFSLRNFFVNYVSHFTTPFFTVMNYFSLVKEEERIKPLGIIFFIVSILYFFFGLGYAIYRVYMNNKSC